MTTIEVESLQDHLNLISQDFELDSLTMSDLDPRERHWKLKAESLTYWNPKGIQA